MTMTDAPPDLRIDPFRLGAPETGITVRCLGDGGYRQHDIAHLSAESLLAWLRSRGGSNPWAENTIAVLLHHEKPIAPEGLQPARVPADLE